MMRTAIARRDGLRASPVTPLMSAGRNTMDGVRGYTLIQETTMLTEMYVQVNYWLREFDRAWPKRNWSAAHRAWVRHCVKCIRAWEALARMQ